MLKTPHTGFSSASERDPRPVAISFLIDYDWNSESFGHDFRTEDFCLVALRQDIFEKKRVIEGRYDFLKVMGDKNHGRSA